MSVKLAVGRLFGLLGGVFMALVAIAMISCATTGTKGPDTRSLDDFLTLHQSLVKLGVEASVITGLKASPDREAVVKMAGTSLEHALLDTSSVSLREALAKNLDFTGFTPTQKLFVDALTDEFSAQLEASKKAYCVDHPTEPVCTTNSVWLTKAQGYAHTFGAWLTEGVMLYHQETGR